ncbi:MAG: Rab family GTPase [Candidatus Helarchaeota archaeon]
MQAGKKDIIQGVVVSRFGDRGPEAIGAYPDRFDSTTLTEISVKAVSILAGEDGSVPPPENLSVLPLPKLHMTAVIYIFEIKNEAARGGVITHTISVLFNEKYTSVIYKTMESLAEIISTQDNLIELLQNNDNITVAVMNLYNQIENFLETRQKDEITRFEIKPSIEKKYEHKFSFKVIVIGDPRVGKTTLILRYIDKAFRELYIPTIGVQVSLKYLELDELTQVKLHLWDIAGQDLFEKVREKFYSGSHAVLLVYDVTNPKTFRNIEKWYLDMVKVVGKLPGFLIGNKIDLTAQVKKWDGKDLAEKLDLQFIETSAKTGENVDLVFQELAKKLVKK